MDSGSLPPESTFLFSPNSKFPGKGFPFAQDESDKWCRVHAAHSCQRLVAMGEKGGMKVVSDVVQVFPVPPSWAYSGMALPAP